MKMNSPDRKDPGSSLRLYGVSGELPHSPGRADLGAESAADMLMVAKYFERIGDHATNIAEWVIFALDDKKMTK